MARLSRLLILSAAYGEGHQQAARAVEAAVTTLCPEADVQILDYLHDVHPRLDAMAKYFYLQSVKYAPTLYKWFYQSTSQLTPQSLIQRQLNSLGIETLAATLHNFRPNIVLATFPTPAGVVSMLKQQGRTNIPLTTLITDHAIHSQWIHPQTDLYFAPSDYVREGLMERGTSPDRVEVTGIPVREAFCRPWNKAELRRELELSEEKPILLLMGGAYGVLGDLGQVALQLAKYSNQLQLIVVAGKNERLYQQLCGMPELAEAGVKIFGFVRDVYRLMAASDLMLTKAGGLTVSESMALGLPLIIYRPIPGQEIQNCHYLTKAGTACLARNQQEIVDISLRLLIDNPEEIRKMRQRALAIRHVNAAEVIAQRLIALANGRIVYPTPKFATMSANSTGVVR
ncbi:MGDG synthase family glycosyltransferase [Alicyclobacillus tolerans]|uniref:Monogalactosyldiacylglycerol synthase n=1 Tax=Alicyclobacillus tolerans TaxID=90970 RepID=A0A1M6TA88_9BACL|nr:glycosyltransferase [Alicyclobacillus montanus]SHK53935.1 Monogalactosyldiacylglycerol synthase [Alicyclobacillus montanus]